MADPTPESLKASADAAEVAGNDEVAETLRNEAEELENATPAEGEAAPQ